VRSPGPRRDSSTTAGELESYSSITRSLFTSTQASGETQQALLKNRICLSFQTSSKVPSPTRRHGSWSSDASTPGCMEKRECNPGPRELDSGLLRRR
jgi:hypothetical protein